MTGLIFTVGGVKGGTAKSLTTANASIVCAMQGGDVMAVDADAGQGNLYDLLTLREIMGFEPKIATSKHAGNLGKKLQELRKKYSDVWVDCGGFDSQELRSALTVADRWIIPICPSQFQIWTMAKLRNLLVQANSLRANFDIPLLEGWFLPARLSPNKFTRLREIRNLEYAVKDLVHPEFEDPEIDTETLAMRDVDLNLRTFRVIPYPIVERGAWREGEARGQSVVELPLSGKDKVLGADKAADELKRMFAFIYAEAPFATASDMLLETDDADEEEIA